MKNRHSQFDVSNSVRVSDTQAVCDAVCDIFHDCYLHADDSVIKRAFNDFDRLFDGNFKGYHSCDTIYHDKQHTLDMTLALARLIDGHERQSDAHHTFGAKLTNLSIITALFHDSGYIRELHDQKHHNGAEYTRIHVSRSATFLRKYMTLTGMEEFADIAANMVHYTGYEVAPENIKLPDKKFHMLGYMIGTADLIAQMSDRCYLEKCRDRLYPEFELGGLTEIKNQHGAKQVIYASGEDLLNKTPEFYNVEVQNRLNTLFKKVYRFAGIHFGGKNLYMDSLQSNIDYVNQLIAQGEIENLRRLPPENPASKILLRTHAAKAH